MQVAIITGASRGLGLALSKELADRGWSLVIDARDPDALAEAEAALAPHTTVRAIPGDVTDPGHRRKLVTAAIELGGAIDGVVNNAS
jgi:NAD(P)-dependent dehydrogenase (short-subunit alcohol dehydrogenase family)